MSISGRALTGSGSVAATMREMAVVDLATIAVAYGMTRTFTVP
jgi:hypothetical protein